MKNIIVVLVFTMSFLTSLTMEKNESDISEYQRLIMHPSDMTSKNTKNSLIVPTAFLEDTRKRYPDVSRTDKNDQNTYGNALLYKAVQQGNLIVAQWLVENADADIHYFNTKTGQLLIHAAAQGGHVDSLAWLYGQGKDIHALAFAGHHAIHLAAYYGHLHVVQWLLEKDVDINLPNRAFQPPLCLAVAGGHVELARWLIQNGAHTSWRSSVGTELIHLAASQGRVAMVQLLLDLGIAHIDDKDDRGLQPLHYAVANGHIETMLWLRDHGADTKACDKENRSLVHIAAMFGRYDTVRQLAMLGFDLRGEDNEGNQPIHLAARYDHKDVLELLIGNSISCNVASRADGRQPLHYAAENDQLEIAQFLVEHGADIHAEDKAGNRPLYYAARNGEHVVRWLVEQKADVNAVNAVGETAVHAAAANRRLEVIRSLDKANLFSRTAKGDLPIHYAASHGNYATVWWLAKKHEQAGVHLQHGLKNNDGDEPIHCAARNGHEMTVKVFIINNHHRDRSSRLIESAMNHDHVRLARFLYPHCNQPDRYALHALAREGRLASTEWLVLERNYDVNVLDENGKLALHHALEQDHFDVVKFLASPSALKAQAGPTGRTPLGMATLANNSPMVNWLLLHGVGSLGPRHPRYQASSLLRAIGRKNKMEVAQLIREFDATDSDEFNEVLPFILVYELMSLEDIPGHLLNSITLDTLSNCMDAVAITNKLDLFMTFYTFAFNMARDTPDDFVPVLESALYWAAVSGNEDIAFFIIQQAISEGRTVNLPLSRSGRALSNRIKNDRSITEQKRNSLRRIGRLVATVARLQISIGVRTRQTDERPATKAGDAFKRLAGLIPGAPHELTSLMIGYVLDHVPETPGGCVLF